MVEFLLDTVFSPGTDDNLAGDGSTPAWLFLFAGHVMRVGGGSPLQAVTVGTARAGQRVHRELESEGSCSPKLGLDEPESDTTPVAWRTAAILPLTSEISAHSRDHIHLR